jgi:hypothetical protein
MRARLVPLLLTAVGLLAAAAPASAARVQHGSPTLPGLRGEPVAMVFFHPWCDVCEIEATAIAGWARTHPGVHVVLVAAANARDADVRRFVERHYAGAPVDVYLDRSGRAIRRWGGNWFPSSAFFTSGGRPAAPFAGFPHEDVGI